MKIDLKSNLFIPGPIYFHTVSQRVKIMITVKLVLLRNNITQQGFDIGDLRSSVVEGGQHCWFFMEDCNGL